jgi:hypothetical protein
VHGYRWYDWQTGAVDLAALAEDAAAGLTNETYGDAPAWIAALPAVVPSATPTKLAALDAAARNAFLEELARRAQE